MVAQNSVLWKELRLACGHGGVEGSAGLDHLQRCRGRLCTYGVLAESTLALFPNGRCKAAAEHDDLDLLWLGFELKKSPRGARS